ncbi:MAG: DUF4493 domain-containing protein [Alistipes sp.]|jgi:hypothetical protein|nr:DUF4493 domain-containing protein [Alistipes sp.]
MKRSNATIAAAAVFAAAAIFTSCNRTTDYETGYGSLAVSAWSDPTVIDVDSPAATRAANLDTKTYHLTLQSGTTVAYDGMIPADGKIENLPAGTYTGTLQSAQSRFTVPAFDAPFYSATAANIVITPGGTTPVAFLCRQINAGVRFVYDTSLATAGLGDIIPVIAQGAGSLAYSGTNRNATGHFTPGGATLTLTLDGTPLTVAGAGSVPMTLAAREVWTVTLRVNPNNGGVGIEAELDTETDGRDMEITVDPSGGGDGGNNGGTPGPAMVVFAADFAKCTGPAYPAEGATFNASAWFPTLTLLSAIEAAGLSGWTFENGYLCAGGLKMGNMAGTTGGTATTPPLAALGDTPATVVLTFLAANFESAPAGLAVSVTGGGSVASGGSITLPAGTPDGGTIAASAAMKRYTVTITGATAATRVVISSAAANRYFLADLNVSR